MCTLHATCQKFLLKYFLERLKIHQIHEIKDPQNFSAIQYSNSRDSSSHFLVIPAQLRRRMVVAEMCPVQWVTLHPTSRPVF